MLTVARGEPMALQTIRMCPPTHDGINADACCGQFAGSGIVIKHQRAPDTCACVSFGAPMTHVDPNDPHNKYVARLWIHLIVIDQTVILTHKSPFVRRGKYAAGDQLH